MANTIESFKSLSLDEKKSVADNFVFAKKNPGTEGAKVRVYGNYAPIKIKPNTIIYMYNIEIKVPDHINEKNDSNIPQKNRIKQQKRMIDNSNFSIFEKFYQQDRQPQTDQADGKRPDQIFTSEPIFDGRKIIYTKTPLNFDGIERIVREVRVKVPEKKFLQTFAIIITKPNKFELDLSILNDHKNLRSAERELQCLDIIITYGAKKFNIFFNSNMFIRKNDLINLNPREQEDINFDLGNMKEARFGSYQAVKLTENGIELNVDRVAMVFFKSGKILDVLEDYLTSKQRRNRNEPPPPRVHISSGFNFSRDIRSINNELKGLNFITDHISYNPKYTMNGLTNKPISEIFFNEGQGEASKKTSVKKYFDEKYKTYLERNSLKEFMDLPAVQVGIKEPGIKYFPMETVRIIDDQYYMKKLDSFSQSTMTTRCGSQYPTDRFEDSKRQIQTLIESSKRCQNDYLNYFGISIGKDFDIVNGRYLLPPKLCGFKELEKDLNIGEWRDMSFFEPAPLHSNFKWIVVNFSAIVNERIRAPYENDIQTLIKSLIGNASSNKLNLGQPAGTFLRETYRNKAQLEDRLVEFIEQFPGLGLIIFLIPEDDDIYAQIKYFTELKMYESGVVTQCVSHKKSNKYKEKTYACNLLLKINSKLGGVNCVLKKDSKVGHLKKKTMIVGLDVTHPSKHDRLGNSVASAVSTFTSNYVNYYTKSVVQPPRKEIIDLKSITVELLDNFYAQQKEDLKTGRKKFFPDYVLVYRDGVSEGQFSDVIEYEINAMKKAFAFIGQENNFEYQPKLTYVIVQKRHHTRFLTVEERDRESKRKNVKPGLVVDRGIVSNFYNDFYLVSHRGAMGTTRPTRYIILHDESGFTGDEIHKTTYYLSHLFPRCQKAISIIPPVQYSHLAAKRARQYLSVLDNKRGHVFGEEVLNESQIRDINQKIEIPDKLINKLFYI